MIYQIDLNEHYPRKVRHIDNESEVTNQLNEEESLVLIASGQIVKNRQLYILPKKRCPICGELMSHNMHFCCY
jgi:hypothetical protein